MSAPPNQDFGQGQEYGQQPYDDQQNPAQPQQDAAGGTKKKKRGYAAGAFDVGAGANAGVAGQVPGGAPQYGVPAPGQPAVPGYGGYPQQDPQQPAQGYQYPQQGGYQAPQGQPAYGGYQAPAPASEYPAPGSGPAPGIGGITQGMGGMNLGQPVQPQQQAAGAPRPQLNQLYPTDLLNQPFNVAELDLPPPPILLPQNVSWNCAENGASKTCTDVFSLSIVKRHPFSRCQLPAKVHSLDTQCRAYDQLNAQEEQTPFCSGHTALWLLA